MGDPIILEYAPHNPPVACLYCLELPPVGCCEKVPSKVRVGSSSRLQIKTELLSADDLSLARVLSQLIHPQLTSTAPSNLDGPAISFSTDVEHQIDFAASLEDIAKNPIEKVQLAMWSKKLSQLDNHLKLRTYLVGHSLTLADIAVYAAVGRIAAFNLKAFAPVMACPNVTRWWSLIDAFNPMSKKDRHQYLSCYNANLQNAKAARSAGASEKPCGAATTASSSNYEGKLPGAQMGLVVTRFPPEPSGYLHIGHAKAALLNAYYAKHYDGRLLIRFDDTNPSKEKMEFETSIIEDLKLLDIDVSVVTHTSDYFEALQKYCETLISNGSFYVDDTELELMRHERGEGIESKCRNLPIDENIRRWQEMKKGSVEGLTCCVRAKIDMQSPNKCMRDPVMYRCNVGTPHHIHGDKYKVYPMYDFACPIVDSLEGVTHAMRTNEYADRIPQYQWVLTACNVRPVIIYEFSRLNFVNTCLSKRKLQWFVDNGIVESWEDPRFPTVRGIRRRGLQVEALMDFLLEQGASKNTNLMEWDKLWTKNKQVLDPKVPRFMAVSEGQSVVVTLSNVDTTEVKERDLHPKNAAVGKADLVYSKSIRVEAEDAVMIEDGEEVTLMRWCNAIVENIERDGSGVVKAITMKLNPTGDFKKTKKKLHWVSDDASLPPTRVVLREFDHLITKKKVEDEDNFEDFVNRDSVHDTVAIADRAVESLSHGDCLQFERRGYFRLDKMATPSSPAVFIMIPDGKCKSMSVVQGKVDAAKLSKGQ